MAGSHLFKTTLSGGDGDGLKSSYTTTHIVSKRGSKARFNPQFGSQCKQWRSILDEGESIPGVECPCPYYDLNFCTL